MASDNSPHQLPVNTFTYLLGMTPMPPLSNKEKAVALFQQFSNDPASGFEHTQHAPPPQGSLVNTVAQAAEAEAVIRNVDFRFRAAASLTSLPTTKSILLPSDTPPNDAFDRICSNLDVRTEKANLGCRFNDDKKTDPPQQLNIDTLPAIFQRAVDLLTNKRRKKEVFISVENLDPSLIQPEAPKRKNVAPKSTEKTSGTTEEELRNHLRCSACKSDDSKPRLCHVGEGGRHIEVTNEKVGLWARLIANGRATMDVLPNSLAFDKTAVDSARPQTVRSNRYSSSSAPSPTIHNHIHVESSKRQRSADPSSSVENTPTKPKRQRSAYYNNDIDPIPLSGLLAALDSKYPAMGLVSKYEIALASEGIAYLDTAVHFDKEFYVKNIGMSRGMASTFCVEAGKEYRRVLCEQKKGKGKEAADAFQ